MSPERIKGDSYSFDSDLWSLGLTLVECALGRFPYPPPQVREIDEPGPSADVFGKAVWSHGRSTTRRATSLTSSLSSTSVCINVWLCQ